MPGNRKVRAVLTVAAATLTILVSTTIEAQGTPGASGPQDPGMMAAQMASPMIKSWLTKAGEQMTDADFVYRPTPDIRTFGQLLGHVADLNNLFCSASIGEQPPVRGVEKSATSRAEILAAMAASFTYCDSVMASLTAERARKLVPFMGSSMPALAVQLFRTHHLSLHYGNAVTYMRLRGRVPPSTAGMP